MGLGNLVVGQVDVPPQPSVPHSRLEETGLEDEDHQGLGVHAARVHHPAAQAGAEDGEQLLQAWK